MMDEGFGISPEMLAKAVAYAALLAGVGAGGARWLIAPRLAQFGAAAEAPGLIRSASGVLLVSSAIGVAALLVRAWTHTLAAFGMDESFAWDNLRIIAIESRWGQGWSRQMLAATATLVLSVGARAGWRGAWPLASIGIVVFCATVPLVGHAAGDPFRLSLHTVHLVGAGLWIGTLFVLLADFRRRGGGTETFQIFAPVALTGASTIVLSGLIAAALYLGSTANLFGTAYGRTLTIKIALVVAAATCGFINWRRMQRASATARAVVSRDAMIRTVGLELALASAVVLATGILTELPDP